MKSLLLLLELYDKEPILLKSLGYRFFGKITVGLGL